MVATKAQKAGFTLGAGSLLLFFLALLFPNGAEAIYGRGIYPYIGKTLSAVSRFFPFSLTDLAFTLIPILLIVSFMRGYRRSGAATGLLNALATAGATYALFLFAWGFNYARSPLHTRLNTVGAVDAATRKRVYTEAAKITRDLRKKLSAPTGCFDFTLDMPSLDRDVVAQQRRLFDAIKTTYVVNGPVKRRFFGELWLSLGNSGIYGPFTGEANVSFPLAPGEGPFILAHERAHLNGFASETDANLIAFLTTWGSIDPAMRYSGWLVFWSYTPEAEWAPAKLPEAVIRDLLCIRLFWRDRTVSAAKLVDGVYGTFLKMQGQKQGLKSYGETTEVILRAFAKNGIKLTSPSYGLIP